MVNKADEEVLAVSTEVAEKAVENAPAVAPEECAGEDFDRSSGEEKVEVADVSTNEAVVEKSATKSAEEWEAMVAEAERRGYLRGRNESISELMKRPGMFERMPDVREVDEARVSREVDLLARERVSIWDK